MPRLPHLRAWREHRMLSLRELADLSGVAHPTISRIELHDQAAQPRTVRALAKALDIEPRQLVGTPPPTA